ncbi:hypothetical protein DAI22_02g288700 [Oryza sativa Japonica Group]|nr:hypothetical protein DAI22_02g288700 [Oryza sativa Japonica Group]
MDEHKASKQAVPGCLTSLAHHMCAICCIQSIASISTPTFGRRVNNHASIDNKQLQRATIAGHSKNV